MDQIEEIMQKCAELGKAIALTDTYQEFKKAEYKLFHNPEACKLVEDLQKLQQEGYRKKIAGIEPTKEEQEKMKKMESVCIKNPQVYLSNEANTKFQDLMEQISGKIKEGIKSVEQPKYDD